MARILLIILGGIAAVNGLVILLAPQPFYDLTPGVSLTGPFNLHFVRDIALAFLASGAAMAYGAWARKRAAAVAGAAWPFLHGLFHLHLWMHRGFALDGIAAFDLALVIIPPAAALALALRLPRES